MKQFAILLLSGISGEMLHAQPISPVQINKSLEIVVNNFSGHLSNLKGTLISKKGSTASFQSNNLPGLQPGVITEEYIGGKTHRIWKVVLYSGLSKQEIRMKYAEVFKYLNNTIIKGGSKKAFIVSGKYTIPSTEATTVAGFDLLPASSEVKDIKLQLILETHGKNNSLSLHVSR